MAKFVRHHVGRVLGPAEAGLDQGEPGLHEDHEHRADHDPQQVDRDRQVRRRRLPRVLGDTGVAVRSSAPNATPMPTSPYFRIRIRASRVGT